MVPKFLPVRQKATPRSHTSNCERMTEALPKKPKKSPHAGHRARLRQKMLESDGDSLADYELIEFLLFSSHPRGDTKPLAKKLIAHFGSLPAVLSALPDQLQAAGLSEAATGSIKIAQIAARRLAKAQIMNRPLLSSWDRLIDWCRIELGERNVEEFHLLFLDKKNKLIAMEQQNKGTVDQIAIYTREVVKRALELNTSAVIMVHNHPSGDPEPSQADIKVTENIKQALGKISIRLHDHLIISKTDYASFKSLGLL